MIVLSDEDQRQLKSPAVTLPALRTPRTHQLHGVASASSLQLPDYDASQLEAGGLPPTPTPPTPVETPAAPPRRRRKWTRLDGRLWRAACYALAFYVLLTMVLGVPFIVSWTRRLTSMLRARALPWGEGGPGMPGMGYGQMPLDDHDMAMVPGMHQCDNWTEVDSADGFYHSRISALLSPTSAFELVSNSSLDNHRRSFGNLTVDVHSDQRVTQATLSIDVVTSSETLRQRLKVCLYPSAIGYRLKLFLPTGLDILPEDTFRLDIKLLFPQGARPLRIFKFITYLPSFAQRLGKLSPFVHFDRVSLTGSGYEIVANGLATKKLFIKNTEAAVIGSFNITEDITIDNYEGPIRTNVTLYRGRRGKGPPVAATLDTGGSTIDAAFMLQAEPSRSFIPSPYTHPAYAIDLKTFNAPIVTSIFHHPSTPPTPPKIRIQNHLAPSTITLDTKYVGSFDVQSKLSTAHVEEASSVSSTFVYEHKSASRTYGRLGVEAHCIVATAEITSSREPVQLRFVDAKTGS